MAGHKDINEFDYTFLRKRLKNNGTLYVFSYWNHTEPSKVISASSKAELLMELGKVFSHFEF